MNTAWVASYVFAGVLIACAVLVMVVLICIATNSEQAPQRARIENERRVMREIMAAEDEEEDRIDVTAGVLAWVRPAQCVSSVNPDGSVAVARELSPENKSVV